MANVWFDNAENFGKYLNGTEEIGLVTFTPGLYPKRILKP